MASSSNLVFGDNKAMLNTMYYAHTHHKNMDFMIFTGEKIIYVVALMGSVVVGTYTMDTIRALYTTAGGMVNLSPNVVIYAASEIDPITISDLSNYTNDAVNRFQNTYKTYLNARGSDPFFEDLYFTIFNDRHRGNDDAGIIVGRLILKFTDRTRIGFYEYGGFRPLE